jgi:hypothetical protein
MQMFPLRCHEQILTETMTQVEESLSAFVMIIIIIIYIICSSSNSSSSSSSIAEQAK